ncbi:hypothetical protein AOXY_G15840 [Acipenser oxyrinchus oxyrinchus]|uniref:Uncharacterized protein n=1 Tax=Acipenser oxyrinchus oxyrinchus TaxID=40147 RepID=A0AAD8D5A6_ACIOX|nr:hypothetical protein AOXY_G15840 [Acipenser oxyrinchus oxyrinchus]
MFAQQLQCQTPSAVTICMTFSRIMLLSQPAARRTRGCRCPSGELLARKTSGRGSCQWSPLMWTAVLLLSSGFCHANSTEFVETNCNASSSDENAVIQCMIQIHEMMFDKPQQWIAWRYNNAILCKLIIKDNSTDSSAQSIKDPKNGKCKGTCAEKSRKCFFLKQQHYVHTIHLEMEPFKFSNENNQLEVCVHIDGVSCETTINWVKQETKSTQAEQDKSSDLPRQILPSVFAVIGVAVLLLITLYYTKWRHTTHLQDRRNTPRS